MICNTFSKEDFKKIEESKKIGKTQYYYVRFNEKEVGGNLIQAVECEIDHMPTEEEIITLQDKYLINLKKGKVCQVKSYDVSSEINSFLINGNPVWMDKATRVGIDNALRMQKDKGITDTSIMFGDTWYDIPVDDALAILASVEVYAMGCFKKTSEHIAAIEALTTADEVSLYDYTAGYPTKLEFVIE